jgi:minor histocompatibility antigen H13
MLGLGDIVIPGLFVAMMLRYDFYQDFRTRYFQSAFWGYVAGLGTTIFVMNYFQAAQPALLYIVPGILSAVLLHAAAVGQFKTIFNWTEPGAKSDEKEEEEAEQTETKEEVKKEK